MTANFTQCVKLAVIKVFNALFACEVRFTSKEITTAIIKEMKEKINRLKLPRGFSVFPVLIHIGSISEKVIDADCRLLLLYY